MTARATTPPRNLPLPSHPEAPLMATSTPPRVQPPLTSPRRQPLPPSYTTVQPLPSTLSLEREGRAASELELDRQTKQLERERALAEALQEQEWQVDRATIREKLGTWKGKGKERGKEGGSDGYSVPFTSPPQAYELYRAIDKHDIEMLMRIRDHAFGLLLQKNAGEFPILYAARIGPGHRDVVILLIGAMSRYVNQLDEEDFEKKETRGILKALRTNLKLAIDNALMNDAHLLSSYLQVLIMSEGDAWLLKAVYEVSLLLRNTASTPVSDAEQMVRRFCTKELRGVRGGVGDVEEYIANAALDLVIMATWSLAAGQMDVETLSTHTFARDLRTWSSLTDAMQLHRSKLNKVGSRVRGFLTLLEELGGDTRKSVRGRLRDVELAIDAGGG